MWSPLMGRSISENERRRWVGGTRDEDKMDHGGRGSTHAVHFVIINPLIIYAFPCNEEDPEPRQTRE